MELTERCYRFQRIFQLKIPILFSGSHTDLNALSSKQHIFMDFFKKLKETSILDDTFIIIVGDHGFRVGEYFSTTAGEYEARYGRILNTSFCGSFCLWIVCHTCSWLDQH